MDQPALAGVDLRVGAGELVCVLGPSGCGKSTLLHIVSGLIEPTAGRVLIDGEEPASRLGRSAYMPQRDLLMPWRTVLDNAALGLVADGAGRREARERARGELARFGLEGFGDRWPAEISGGMRQRTALLRTFLTGRDLILLDEPFAALDALTRQAMREWLLEVWSAEGKTIVFVTHDVEEAVFLADRVYVLSARPGRVEACVDVDLPRPRTLESTSSRAFVDLRRRLLAGLAPASPGGSS